MPPLCFMLKFYGYAQNLYYTFCLLEIACRNHTNSIPSLLLSSNSESLSFGRTCLSSMLPTLTEYSESGLVMSELGNLLDSNMMGGLTIEMSDVSLKTG